MSGSAEQLLRLLRLIPLAARPEGIRVEEAARLCGVSEAQIDRDFRVVADRAWYLPPGRTDDFQILMEGDRIFVHAPPAFGRPIRLGLHELLAVSLALRCVGMEREEARDLMTALETACAMAPEPDAGAGADEPLALVLRRSDSDEVHDEISRALVHRRRVRIEYMKEGAEAPQRRDLEPWFLLHAEGEAYLLAYDLERDDPRLFRLDRVLGAGITPAPCTEPITLRPPEVSRGGMVRLVDGDAPQEFAEVRYSSRVARWLRERHDGESADDGSFTVKHPILSDGWVVRHVLSYGPDAEILRPNRLRQAVLRAVGAEPQGSWRP